MGSGNHHELAEGTEAVKPNANMNAAVNSNINSTAPVASANDNSLAVRTNNLNNINSNKGVDNSKLDNA